MLQAVTFDFWGTLYQNAYAQDERLRLLERRVCVGTHLAGGAPLHHH